MKTLQDEITAAELHQATAEAEQRTLKWIRRGDRFSLDGATNIIIYEAHTDAMPTAKGYVYLRTNVGTLIRRGSTIIRRR